MKHQFTFSVAIGLIPISALAISPAHAITDKESLVAPMFLNWQAAWKELPSYDRPKYLWIPQAQSAPQWNFDDAPLLKQKALVNQAFASKEDGQAIVDRYHDLALRESTATNRFAYGYAAWKRYQQTLERRKTEEAMLVMGQNYVPSYQYTRLLLLFPTQNDNNPKVFEPLLQRLYKRNPKDFEVESRLTDILTNLPTSAARAQGERLLQSRTKRLPGDLLSWYKLGYFYDERWLGNSWLMNKTKSPQIAAQAHKAALRDSSAALSAYNHATMVAEPDSIWLRSSRAMYVNRILKWKKNNP